jgi:hypothetical protein
MSETAAKTAASVLPLLIARIPDPRSWMNETTTTRNALRAQLASPILQK